MRLIVMSDSHSASQKVKEIIAKNKDTADTFIHLGDGIREFQDANLLWPELSFVCVRGNNDWEGTEPKTLVISRGGHRLMLTHGDLFRVKYSIDELEVAARAEGVEAVLYGHTHIAAVEYRNGLYLMNPGSVVNNRYGHASYFCLDLLPTGFIPSVQRL